MKIIMRAMMDLSKALGLPFQYDHPDVWRTLDGIVAKARQRNIIVAANMGYAYTTPVEMRGRVQKLHEHGVRICLMQGADSMLENLAGAMLSDIRGAVAAK